MAWRCKESGHQQPWYWIDYPGIFRFQHQRNWHNHSISKLNENYFSGFCPIPHPGSSGLCAEWCRADRDCGAYKKCCSNGCGHECQTAVHHGEPVTGWSSLQWFAMAPQNTDRTQQFVKHHVQTDNHEASRLGIAGRLWEKSTGGRWFMPTNGQWCEKLFIMVQHIK